MSNLRNKNKDIENSMKSRKRVNFNLTSKGNLSSRDKNYNE